MTFYREGKPQTTTVTIAELPPAPEVLSAIWFQRSGAPRGPEGDGRVLEIDQVVAGGPAFEAGLRPGMRILAVGEQARGTQVR